MPKKLNAPEVEDYKMKNLFLTWNNYTQEEYDDLILWLKMKTSYYVIGKEIGKKGTPHLQGCCWFNNSLRFSTLKKKFPKIHMQKVKNAHDAIKYCKKENDFVEEGEPPKQGARNDLNKLKTEIIDGKKIDDIVMEDPLMFHQYGRTIEKIENICNKNKWRTWMTQGTWYYGETGVGKSRMAFDGYHPNTHYQKNLKSLFWDGYTGQEKVIINEYRGQMLTFSDILELCDMHPYTVDIKGKSPVPFLAKEVIITSCYAPEEVFKNVLTKEDNIEQFYRRFNVVRVEKPCELKNDEDVILCPGSGQGNTTCLTTQKKIRTKINFDDDISN